MMNLTATATWKWCKLSWEYSVAPVKILNLSNGKTSRGNKRVIILTNKDMIIFFSVLKSLNNLYGNWHAKFLYSRLMEVQNVSAVLWDTWDTYNNTTKIILIK